MAYSEAEPLLSSSVAHIILESDESTVDLITEADHLATSFSQEQKPKLTLHLVLAMSACVAGSSFQVGYNTGVVNLPEKVINDFYNHTYVDRTGEPMPPSTLLLLWSVTVSIFCVGGMIGGFLAGYAAIRFGRKGALLLNNVLAVAAAILMWASQRAGSYEMIIVGRFIIGINAGINSGVCPMYLMEISPVELRGMIGTINQLTITLGILTSQILGLNFTLGSADLWPILLALTGAPVIIQLCTLTLCPESPRYLLINKREDDEAERALVWLRETHDVGEEMEELRQQLSKQDLMKTVSILDLFRSHRYHLPLLISVVLQLSQQLSGINAVTFYSTGIFQAAELSATNAQYATIGMGGLMVIMTFVSAVIVDRAGRRILHLTGLGGMFTFSVLLTIALIFEGKVSWLTYIAIISVGLYVVSFAIGPGSIPWFIVPELFAEESRSPAISIAILVNWAANTAVGLSFPSIREGLDNYMFLPFAGMLALFWVFTFFKLPETKGKTIQQITQLFDKPSRKSN